jgi:hypothetical protein
MKFQGSYKKHLKKLLIDINAMCTKIQLSYQVLTSYFSQLLTEEHRKVDFQYSNDLKKHQHEYHQKISTLQTNNKNEIQRIESAYHHSIKQHTGKYHIVRDQLKTDYTKKLMSIDKQIKDMAIEHYIEWASWDDPNWSNYQPVDMFHTPPLTRFGNIQITCNNQSIHLPALLPVIASKNVLFKASGKYKDKVLRAMESMMMRLLIAIPPGKLKFVLIDPVGLGSNMAGFMHLPESIVGQRIHTRPNKIEDQLAEIRVHMETVIQKYLRNDYQTMEAYNKDAGEVEEPYRILVIANFPVNFTEETAKDLLSIAENGPARGVYVIILLDTQLKLPYNFQLNELERFCTIISQKGNQLIWHDSNLREYDLTLDQLPPKPLFDRLIQSISDKTKQLSNVEVPFERIFKDNSDLWYLKSDKGLSVPIGRAGARDLQYFSLGTNSTLQHVIIAGKTGSGKSNLLHVIIMSLCCHYSPDELIFYLIDFKEGIEFKTYAENKLPHAKVIAIQSEREFALSVLQGMEKELEVRGNLFRSIGVQNIKEYRTKNSKAILPRIVLLVDEFQDFFTPDDLIASQISTLLDNLVRKGRAFGIHIILSSQALAGSTIPRVTADQMAIRIALVCTDADSRFILGDDNPEAKLLSRPGEAIYNDSNGLIEGNSRFQSFYLNENLLSDYISKVKQQYKYSQPNGDQIVFEGNQLAHMHSNKELRNEFQRSAKQNQYDHIKVWFGEPVELKPHTSFTFQRQSRSNLLIIGQNEEYASSLIAATIIGIHSQLNADHFNMHIINLSKGNTKWYTLIDSFPSFLNNKIVLYNNRQVEDIVETLYNQTEERDIMSNEQGKPIFLIIIGLHRARCFRSEDGFSLSQSSENLINILKNGPDLGIHTICWCDTFRKFESTLERNVSEFDYRIALQMNMDESNGLIDSPIASKLGNCYALLYDEENNGLVEKFRPYSLPSEEWLKNINMNNMPKKTIKTIQGTQKNNKFNILSILKKNKHMRF